MEKGVTSHKFDITIGWDMKSKNGQVSGGIKKPFTVGSPPEFGGTEENWSPEHLLAVSVAGCYLTTFLHFADVMNVGVKGISVNATVKFDKLLRGFEATQYIIYPEVAFDLQPSDEVMEQLFTRAKKYCFISNSVKGEVIVEKQILA